VYDDNVETHRFEEVIDKLPILVFPTDS